MLAAQGLQKVYGRRTVVRSATLEVSPGEVVGLLGPNGAGKSTTFQMVVGLVRPTAGKVVLNGNDITPLPLHRRARIGIGYLPQEASIFRGLTVRKNLRAVAEVLPISRKEGQSRVERLLEQFSLAALGDQPATTLSGGERRRLEIARTLLGSPQFLLLDEPFSGVDPINVQEVQRILIQLRSTGIGILITDHSVRETLAIVDRAYLIHRGEVLASGSREALLNDPLSRRFYLGEEFA
ncbi:MAG: LPS export ABC transporter ATP-binding protein [Puniceicoccales bacterium]|nr:LPS export ABC transporter ATP-binding protein [Puniceicoccales bacterium]